MYGATKLHEPTYYSCINYDSHEKFLANRPKHNLFNDYGELSILNNM